MARYGREATAAPRGNAAKTMGFLAASIEDDGIDSLTHLVVLILVAEAGLLELDSEAQGTIVDAVREELLRKGVPARFALEGPLGCAPAPPTNSCTISRRSWSRQRR